MKFAGIQKMTLLDFPGLVACTLFTDGCNFSCPFCHNASLVLPERRGGGGISDGEVLAFLQKRRGLLDGVVVTGGEPLLHSELPEFLGRVRALGFKVKLDTNGSRPDVLRAALENGLVDYIAMDVKNSPELYAKTAGLDCVDLGALAESKDMLLRGTVDYEFRTTAVRGLHTTDSIRGAAAWISGAKAYFLQQYKDSGDIVDAGGLGSFDAAEMLALADAAREFVQCTAVRGI